MDRVTPAQRSANMAAVRQKDTTPEIRVRKLLHSLGYRYRLHAKDLPGKPDIVLPKHHLCIFVHGCFWHQHSGCRRATIPGANREFWLKKLVGNRERDIRIRTALEESGWRVAVIWECWTNSVDDLLPVIEKVFTERGMSKKKR